PLRPAMKVVDERENSIGWCLDARRPLDVQRAGLRGGECEQCDDEDDNRESNIDQHELVIMKRPVRESVAPRRCLRAPGESWPPPEWRRSSLSLRSSRNRPAALSFRRKDHP